MIHRRTEQPAGGPGEHVTQQASAVIGGMKQAPFSAAGSPTTNATSGPHMPTQCRLPMKLAAMTAMNSCMRCCDVSAGRNKLRGSGMDRRRNAYCRNCAPLVPAYRLLPELRGACSGLQPIAGTARCCSGLQSILHGAGDVYVLLHNVRESAFAARDDQAKFP